MSERVVESSVDEVPEIPEILEKVLLFSLDRAKTKMEAGEDIIPFAGGEGDPVHGKPSRRG